MTASGTAGHGTELGRFVDLGALGAVVVKSLSADPWPGNPPPRIHETPAGMINSVGLQGPGVGAWLDHELPGLRAAGARVVASIWGTSVGDYERAAAALAGAPGVAAVEVNLSCPNLRVGGDGGVATTGPGEVPGHTVFAHDADLTREAMRATSVWGLPRWAKLSPNVTDLVPVASAARDGGAEAVTLVNTVMAMSVDPATRRPRLGGGGGGSRDRRCTRSPSAPCGTCTARLPDLPVVGVGGVATGEDAVELLLAGASAVQVGTATFAEPAAVQRISAELVAWCGRNGVSGIDELVGAAHEGGPRRG
ncbi:MAG: dihydroorotate dehydrogenase [Acidimicrobiia bacterium]|nr:dihydroorotate dehydrogenase [Acidimicrobiia bacterium]